MSESSPGPRWLIVLITGNVIFGIGLFFHAFLYNFYLQELGHSEVTMGYAAAALTAGGLLGLLPAGWIADRFGARPTLVAASLVATAGLAMGALVQTPITIYGMAALSGLGGGLWRVAIGPALVRLTTPGNRPRAFAWNVGLLVTCGGLGIAGAGAIPGWVANTFSLGTLAAIRLALILGALSTAFSLLAFATVPLTTAVPHIPRDRTVSDHNGDGFAGWTGIAILITSIWVWMLGPAIAAQFFNIFFAREWGIALERIGLIFAAGHVLAGLAVLASGELATRIGVGPALTIPLLLYAPMVWGVGIAQSLGLVVSLYIVQGLISPVTNPLIDQLLFSRTPRSHHGTVSSWRNVAADLSAMSGAAIAGGILEQTSFALLFFVSGAVGLLGALGLIWRVRFPRTSFASTRQTTTVAQ